MNTAQVEVKMTFITAKLFQGPGLQTAVYTSLW